MAEVQVRQAAPLRTVPGVELAAVGTWEASTGRVTFTPEDFANAVAALECPGVRNPVIKLGHMEPDSTSGVRWDGEPALGWIGNMHLDGAKLIGDYVGMPAWLASVDDNGMSVLASAYPDRSIEIRSPFVCQVGHTHPSVITAVALLGVAPPGVGVLKSMQDVYAAFTEPMVGDVALASADQINRSSISTTVRLAAPRDPTEIERQAGTDFAALDAAHDEALAELLDRWPTEVSDLQRAELSAQIAAAVDQENGDALGAMTVTTVGAAALLFGAMSAVALAAAAAQIAEAAHQGVTILLPEHDVVGLQLVADGVASTMGTSTAAMAGRTAAQLLGTGNGHAVAEATTRDIAALSDRFLRDQIGGALSAAEASGRFAALKVAPAGEYYASEFSDGASCLPCSSIDGTRFDSLAAAESAYGSGKYVACQGRSRCRGRLVTVWDASEVDTSTPMHTTIRMSIGDTMPTSPGAAVRASVSVEDISRQYYEAAGYSMWITAMHVDPLELIAADDSSGKFFRIPVELKGNAFTFGAPQEVAIVYENVKAATAALPYRWSDRKAAFAAAGVSEPVVPAVTTTLVDPTPTTVTSTVPPIAPDVSPAGAAIRQMAATAVTDTPDVDVAAGQPDDPKKEASVPSIDAAKLREALGLPADAELTRDVMDQAFATLTPAPETPAVQASAIPAESGAIVLDKANYEGLIALARKGEVAYERMERNERDGYLKKAMEDGRFPVVRLSAYEAMWDKNPAECRALVELMPKNSIPTMSVGFLGAEVNTNEADAAYVAMYGEGK